MDGQCFMSYTRGGLLSRVIQVDVKPKGNIRWVKGGYVDEFATRKVLC